MCGQDTEGQRPQVIFDLSNSSSVLALQLLPELIRMVENRVGCPCFTSVIREKLNLTDVSFGKCAAGLSCLQRLVVS